MDEPQAAMKRMSVRLCSFALDSPIGQAEKYDLLDSGWIVESRRVWYNNSVPWGSSC